MFQIGQAGQAVEAYMFRNYVVVRPKILQKNHVTMTDVPWGDVIIFHRYTKAYM